MIYAIPSAVNSKEDSSMRIVWPVLLVIFRALYFIYSVWCLFFPLAAIWFFLTLSRQDTLLGLSTSLWHQYLLGASVLFGVGVLVTVHARRAQMTQTLFKAHFCRGSVHCPAFGIARPVIRSNSAYRLVTW
jgi:hypothetical protein